MSDAFPNHVDDSLPWSPQAEPAGPDYPALASQKHADFERLSHDSAGDLYKGLPDIAVPKHRVN